MTASKKTLTIRTIKFFDNVSRVEIENVPAELAAAHKTLFKLNRDGMVVIVFAVTEANPKNEAGYKRLARILKAAAAAGYEIENTTYPNVNYITLDEILAGELK